MFKCLNVKTLKGRGFTVIEMLVVSGIIILLTGIVLTNYQSNSQQLSLLRSAYKLSQDVRKAGEMSMSAKEFQGNVPQGGYGVYLRSSGDDFYKLYADTNGNEKYNEGDGEIETIFFEKGVIIKNISSLSLSINFRPPNPTIKIKDGAGNDSISAVITLSLKSDPTKIKNIIVNTAGLTEVK